MLHRYSEEIINDSNVVFHDDLKFQINEYIIDKVLVDHGRMKPAYGYIFSDFISGYKMWGHCDIDTLMGHLEDFITDRDIAIYDKMFTLGHMIIYKNTEENNRLFMKDFRGVSLYRESFTTDKITVFDEEGISNGININQLIIR